MSPTKSDLDKSASTPSIRQQVIATQFAGPLPPPDVLERYEEIASGAARRIITLAEKQARHRQEMERKATKKSRKAASKKRKTKTNDQNSR